MARPQKQTVDYFPHQAKHGKTIYILEQKYHEKGYTLWFKLLEGLCSHNGHFIDFNDSSEIEYLAVSSGFSTSETLEVLDLLANLNAIDPILWQKKIVWSDNFIENISDAYRNRTSSVPTKPVSDVRNEVSDVRNEVSDVRNPHTILNESSINIVAEATEELVYEEEYKIPKRVKKIKVPPAYERFIINGKFDDQGYINQVLIKAHQRHIQIIGKFFLIKKMTFPSYGSLNASLNRFLPDAKVLQDYSDEQIEKAMDYVLENITDWKLSTINKYISDPIIN